MPLTFFAHQAVVLPLKIARPRWFDGVALCVGSMAPDFAYAISGTRLEFASHAFAAQFYWGLPVTWIVSWLFRSVVARPLAEQSRGRFASALHAIAASSPPLFRTITSALIGCFSHIALDGATHTDGWIAQRVAWLRAPVSSTMTVAHTLQYVGHSIGTLIGAYLLFLWIARHPITNAGSSTVPLDSRRTKSRAFVWIGTFFVGLASFVAAQAFHTIGGVAVPLMRAACVVGLGCVVAGVATNRSSPPASKPTHGSS